MPTLMQEIHLMHLRQLSEMFQSRWIVFRNPSYDETFYGEVS